MPGPCCCVPAAVMGRSPLASATGDISGLASMSAFLYFLSSLLPPFLSPLDPSLVPPHPHPTDFVGFPSPASCLPQSLASVLSISIGLPDPNPPQSGSCLQVRIGFAHLCVPLPLPQGWAQSRKASYSLSCSVLPVHCTHGAECMCLIPALLEAPVGAGVPQSWPRASPFLQEHLGLAGRLGHLFFPGA